MRWLRFSLFLLLCLAGTRLAAAQTIGAVPAIPPPVQSSDQIFIFRGSAPVYSTTVATLLSGLTTGVFGPVSSTNGFVPVWNGVAGNSLAAGLPVGVTGSNTIVETNGAGVIATTILPASVSLLGNAVTGSGAVVLKTSPTLATPHIAGASSGSVTLIAAPVAGGTLTFPNVTGTLITNADIGSVGNSVLKNSSITINGQTCTLGGSCVIPVAAAGFGAKGPFGRPIAYACFDTKGMLFSFPFQCL